MNEPVVIVLDIKKVLEQLGLESRINLSEIIVQNAAEQENHLEFSYKEGQHQSSVPFL